MCFGFFLWEEKNKTTSFSIHLIKKINLCKTTSFGCYAQNDVVLVGDTIVSQNHNTHYLVSMISFIVPLFAGKVHFCPSTSILSKKCSFF